MKCSMVRVAFTRAGRRQFFRVNRSLGSTFIRGFVLCSEVAEYIAAHEAAGVRLDDECQEIRYDEHIALLVKKMQGVWYVTDVALLEPAEGYAPLFTWMKIKRGCAELLAHVLCGWKRMPARRELWT